MTVNVTDVEEEGTVTVAPPRGWDGTAFTADLTDDDGDTSGETWTWARSSKPLQLDGHTHRFVGVLHRDSR